MSAVDWRASLRAGLVAALVLSAAGAALAWSAAPLSASFPLGIPLLVFAALAVVLSRSWAAAAAAGAAAALVLLRVLTRAGQFVDPSGRQALAITIGRWLQLAGALAALALAVLVVVAARRWRGEASVALRESAPPAALRERAAQWAQIAALLVLSAICAEYLQAYDDSTGRPLTLLAGLLVFVPLYGAPALLIREAARHTGRGWPTMLLLAAALGVLQPGVIDQSLFSASYRDIAGWDESLRATYIAPLGLSAFMAQSFILGHVVFSFSAPIALAEAMRPAAASLPWLGAKWLVLVAVLYVGMAAMVLQSSLATESSHASAPQVVGTLVIAAALIGAAFSVGRRPRRDPNPRPAPRVRSVLIAGFVATTAYMFMPESWMGFAGAALVVAVAGTGLLLVSRRAGWSPGHAAAVALGAVLSRALLAFTYYPVIGEVSAVRKYGHNLILLGLMVAVGVFVLWRARGWRPNGGDGG